MLEFTMQVAGPSSAAFHTAQSFQSCQESNGDIIAVITCLDENRLPIDLREATGLVFALQKPDGTNKEYAADIVTNGMDGRLAYVLNATEDLDQVGVYFVQAKFEIAGSLKTTRWDGFRVLPNIVEPVGP